ncbi:MAG: linear amide C-N hydrolase, partial [Bdellovibrionota bacterium]
GLFMNPGNLQKHGELLGAKLTPAQWTSKWRSITFSTAGAEFPVSGFNEKGLAMGVLQLPEAQYPVITDPRPGLGAGQFVQYNLDRSETIEEVLASTQVVRPYSSIAKMHFFACDASKHCAVLQWVNGSLNVYRDAELKYEVLTNSLYPASAKAADACVAGNCTNGDTSLWRFATVAKLRNELRSDQPFASQAFGILNRVAQTSGAMTRFQLVLDPREQTVKIRKFGSAEAAELEVNFAEASCLNPRQFIPITAASKGDLGNSWQPLTQDIQTDMALQMGYPASAAAAYGRFPFEGVKCLGR